jgi:aminomethyltransferase
MIDVSPLFKYRVSGPDAFRFVNRLITRDLNKCKVGQAYYAPICNDDGKVIDEGPVQRLDEQLFRVTTTRPGHRWLLLNAVGMNVKIVDESASWAALALQGPMARNVLKQVTDADLDNLKYFRIAHNAKVDGITCDISRTGYTGDLGYEIWVPAEDAPRLYSAVREAGKPYGVMPAGMLAMLMCRVEAGLVMTEAEYVSALDAMIPDQMYSPYELNLGWTVNLNGSEDFVGRKALAEEKRVGPRRKMVGLHVDFESFESWYDKVGLPPELPEEAWDSDETTGLWVGPDEDEEQIGKCQTLTWSPIAKKLIALGSLWEPEYAKLGTEIKIELNVEHIDRMVKATVVKTPFYDPPHKRA